MAADINSTMDEQHSKHEGPALKTAPNPCSKSTSNNNTDSISQKAFNIQLPYDINQAMEQNAWDSNFHPISIHSSMEHITSDIKNIKTSLC